MIKNRLMGFILIPFLLLPLTFLGCSGGGDSSPSGGDNTTPPSPSIQVLPADYNFGSVTPGNSPAPLEVEIANNGNLGLNVDDITLSDTTNFSLDLSKGSNPCFTASSTIAAGDNCTAEVVFNPGFGSDATFNTNLTITSDDPDNPTLNVPLSGTREAINELNVKINQVETSCDNPLVTAYVSVIDQGGYPVTTLNNNSFWTVTEEGTGGYSGPPTSSPFVENNATLSVAIVMDYSGSISTLSDALGDMEESAVNFVNNLAGGDEAEIVKFATDIQVAQPFTSSITELIDAIQSPVDLGDQTALYDAVVKGVEDTALRSNDRKAVILITDGIDRQSEGVPLSDNTLNDVIDNANSNGIPIFTIGLGDEVDTAVLQQMADDTGGHYYAAATSDNLRTIYEQLANVLFKDQYILTYTSGLGPGPNTNLTIEATLGAIKGNDTKGITTSCP